MNIDLRFQDWSLVLLSSSVRQFDDNAHQICVAGDLPEGWQWKLYVSVFSEAYFNAIPLTETDGELSALLTRDDLAFGDTTYTLQLIGEKEEARRHTNPVRLYVGASLSGDGVWPEVPRSFTDAEHDASSAAARAEQAAVRAETIVAGCARRSDVDALEQTVDQIAYELEHTDAYLGSHAADERLHITPAERAAWNAKADPEGVMEPILTYVCDGTEGGSITFQTDGNGESLRLKKLYLAVKIGTVSASGNLRARPYSDSTMLTDLYFSYGVASSGYRCFGKLEPDCGFWTSECSATSSNGFSLVYKDVRYLYKISTEQHPYIDTIMMLGTLAAGTTLELYGVRA